MPSPAEVARAHYRRQAVLSRDAASAVEALWSQMDPGDLDGSFTVLGPRMARLVALAQFAAAGAASKYVSDAVEAAGHAPDPLAVVDPRGFAGTAADGGDLESLLRGAVIRTKALIASGVTPADALLSGRARVVLYAANETTQAGVSADGAATAVDRKVTGYRRMLVGPSCSRCVLLAGKFYRTNEGFRRHPHCFPAGVVVSGPSVEAAARRWHEGELVIITTASGQRLPATGNHPVLTDRGWVPAHLVTEGDDVVRSTAREGAVALVVPDEDQVPTRIENAWGAGRMVPLGQVPTSAEDFHGDGGHGDVDVVLVDRLLRHRVEAALAQRVEEELLARGVAPASRLALGGARDEVLVGLLGAAHGLIGGGRLGDSLLGGHLLGADLPGLSHAAHIYAERFEAATDHGAAHAVAEAEAVLTLAAEVRRRDLGVRQHDLAPRWDAPAGPLTVESRMAYADRGNDLRLRLAGQVELDRVVEVSRVQWSGHVYNLTSSEGWYCANGLIVSNCDCRHIPAVEAGDLSDVTVNPRAYFDSLTAEQQNATFGKADAEALRNGADMSRVVNARASTYTPTGRKTSRGTPTKATVEDCLRRGAGDRDATVRALRAAGYLRE